MTLEYSRSFHNRNSVRMQRARSTLCRHLSIARYDENLVHWKIYEKDNINFCFELAITFNFHFCIMTYWILFHFIVPSHISCELINKLSCEMNCFQLFEFFGILILGELGFYLYCSEMKSLQYYPSFQKKVLNAFSCTIKLNC